MTNSVATGDTGETQQLTFATRHLLGRACPRRRRVDPVYRAFVPIFVAPPTPQITSISADGQNVTGGTTSANNSNAGSELSFNISGLVSGPTNSGAVSDVSGVTVSVYMDGNTTTPVATGTVSSGTATMTLTTDGSTTIPAGPHTFTVVQTIATSAIELYADWTGSSGNQSPGVIFPIAASSVNSAASSPASLTIDAPSVQPGANGSSTFATTYTPGGSAVAMVSPQATITAPASPTLASMTITIENPPDGGSEQLTANTAGTALTSSYANGALTVSGTAGAAAYQTVLRSVHYSDDAPSATAGDRTISIVVNDGTVTSSVVTTTVTVV